jgi:glutamate carboxypeptidase
MGLTSEERRIVEAAATEPMLDQLLEWSAVNSGSRNLPGLERVAAMLADAFSALPGELELLDPAPVESVDSAGKPFALDHGQNLRLRVRPDAQAQLLFTGHMDTVFALDHPFQKTSWIEDGVLNGPGVADMKGGLAVMLAALKAVEESGAAGKIGYEVVINSDEEVGSLSSAPLLEKAARGKVAALT